MALHVTLTGLRGLVAPPLVIAAYHALDAVQPGLGPYSLLVPVLLVLLGARRFQLMHRDQSAAAGR
jgi:hypothetical protein